MALQNERLADAECRLLDIGIIVLTEEHDGRSGHELTNQPARFDAVHPRQTDIQNDDIGPQCSCLIYSFAPVACLSNDVPFWVIEQNSPHCAAPFGEVVYRKNR